MRGDDILENAGLKSSPFRVPEGYFDDLPGQVASRVATCGKAGGRKVAVRWFWPLAAAATLAIVSVGVWRFAPPASYDISASEDQEYLMRYMDVSAVQLADYGENDTQDSITQDEIIEYLAFNDLSGEYIYDRMAEAE